MRLLGVVLLGTLLMAPLCDGQSSSAAGQAPAALGHGAFPVKITKTLDSSKLKQDDTIEVETANSFKLADGTLIPKGSKLEGRVVSAKARSKGDPDSELTLAFNKLSIQGGKQLSLKGSVQAVFPPAEDSTPNMATMGTSQGGSAHGSTVGGGGASPGGVGLTNSQSGSDMESSNSQAVMSMKATGVQGMHDLSLENGVLSSKGKNVKLGGGVRMVVHVDFVS